MARNLILTAILTLAVAPAAFADSPPEGLKLENLLKAELEGFEGAEVIVSRVTVPPNTSLPKHWHPGEEFAYILEGSCYLWQDGKEDILGRTGDVDRRQATTCPGSIDHDLDQRLSGDPDIDPFVTG